MNQEPVDDHQSAWDVVFSVSLYLGLILSVLGILEFSRGLPLSMPTLWGNHLILWQTFGFLLVGVGLIGLRERPPYNDAWKPEWPGARFQRLVLYTRYECHLCDQAKDTLLEYAAYLPELEEIDIDDDEQLVEQHGDWVPVVEIDGKVRFRGRVSVMLLRRLIEGTLPRNVATVQLTVPPGISEA